MRRTLSALTLTTALFAAMAALATPAQAWHDDPLECYTYGGDGICYEDDERMYVTVPSVSYGTEELCLGSLGCTPGQTLVSTPETELAIPRASHVCVSVDYECYPQ